jgi:hypothetical protein
MWSGMLYGMQGMSSDVRRVRWLDNNFPDCSAAAGPLEEGSGGKYAVRYAGHGSDAPEVRSVLDMLPGLLGSCKGAAECSGGGQYAVTVQGMSSDAPGCGQCWICFPGCWAAAGAVELRRWAICCTVCRAEQRCSVAVSVGYAS